MKIFAASIPRKMFWSDKVPNKIRCPYCKSKLESEYHTYMFLTTSSIGDDTFIAGSEFGRFCRNCPIVVLDRAEFNKIAVHIVKIDDYKNVENVRYVVVGIVDLEAISKDKARLSLGEEGNPVPLVEFCESIERKIALGGVESEGKRLSGNERRRRQKYKNQELLKK